LFENLVTVNSTVYSYFLNLFDSFLFIIKNNNILLLSQIILPFLGFIFIIFFNTISRKSNTRLIWEFSFWLSQITLVLSCLLVYYYNESSSIFQYTIEFVWETFFNINIVFGLDGISILMILLTNYLIVVCILLSWTTISFKLTTHLSYFFLLQFFLILSFSVLDLMWFYVFFEGVLIPMFLLVGIWGSRNRKIRATYQLFVYTVFGSLLLLFTIVYLYTICGTTDIRSLYLIELPFKVELVLWLALFISFSVKTPMFPFHIWLPEAHVEASTTGSVILAGVLLKLGTYGMFRFLVPLFPFATKFFSIFVYVLCILAIIYISYTIISQIDLKKIIAYSSIVHMSFIILGLFSFNYYGIEGAILMMINHGLVAGGLFILIGSLYKRFHTRIVLYYSSLVSYMPLFSIFFFLFILFNIGFPGTGGFISEVLIFSSVEFLNPSILLFMFFGYLLSVVYSIWLYNRICFGSTTLNYTSLFIDLKEDEVSYYICLSLLVVLMGIFPNYLCKLFSNSIFTFCLQFYL